MQIMKLLGAWTIGLGILSGAGVVDAAGPTSAPSFDGTWQTTVKINGQPVQFQSVIGGNHYANSVIGVGGTVVVGKGTFVTGADGTYRLEAEAGLPDHGTWRFDADGALVMHNAFGVDVTWKRVGAAEVVAENPLEVAMPAGTDVKAVTPRAIADAALPVARKWHKDAVLVGIKVDNPVQDGTVDLTTGGVLVCSYFSPSSQQGVLALAAPTGVMIVVPIGFPPGPNTLPIPADALDLPKAMSAARADGLNVRFTGAELNTWHKSGNPVTTVWSMKTIDDTGNLSCLVSAANGKLVPGKVVMDDAIGDYNQLAANAQRAVQGALQRAVQATQAQAADDSGSQGLKPSAKPAYNAGDAYRQGQAAQRANEARARGDGAAAAREDNNAHH